MRIRGWHVEGFGVFCDYRVSNLPAGLVVVHGPNEAGKSTLLAFLRGVLFGFPDRRSSEPQYLPLAGGRHGGTLLLENAEGAYRVERIGVRKGGAVTVTRPDGSDGGEEDLQRLRGSADLALFKSVFAFSLHELAALETLSNEKVRSHILSAGIAGAGKSARDVTDALRREADQLLAARAGRIRELVKEGEALSDQIDAAVRHASQYAESLRCEEEAARLVTQLRAELLEAEARERRARALIEAWPTESERQQALGALKTLPVIDAFPPDGDARLAAALSDARAASDAHKRAELALQQLVEARRAIVLDDRLQAVSSAATHLISEAEVQRSRLARIAELQDDSVREPASVEALEREQRALQRIRPRLAELAQAEADKRAEERLRSEGRAEQLPARELGWLRWAPAAFAAIAIVCAALAAWRLASGDLPVGLALTVACVTTALSAVGLRALSNRLRPGDQGARQQREDEAARRLADLTRRAAELRAAVGDDAAILQLPPLPTVERVEDRQAEWSAQVEARRRHDEARTLLVAVGEWEARVREVLDAAGVTAPHGRHERWIDAARDLALRATDAARARQEAARLDAAIGKATPEVEQAQEQRDEAARTLAALFAEAAVSGEQEFRERSAAYRNRQRLLQQVADLETRLVALLGRGDEAAAMRRELSAGRVADWREERVQAETEVAQLRERHEAAIRAHQDLVNGRRRVEEAADVAQLELQRQAVCDELASAIHRRRVTSLAARLVDETLRVFERTRQPEVLAHASRTFERVTDGRYPRIVQTNGDDGVAVLDSAGERRAVGELSRGTQEQLYLSMRLGLAREFGQRDVPLPLVMDDVLVNFDERRARRMATELIAFAATQQVLLFTCHEFVRAMLLELDPHLCVIDLPSRTGGLSL